MCDVGGVVVRLGGWAAAAAAAEDVDEHRPPDVQLGRCQGHTLVVRLHESLNSFGSFLTLSRPRIAGT